MAENTKVLSDCRPGHGGRVARVNGDGPVVQRLLEMGVVTGTNVRVVRVAPLGDPIEIEVQSYRLSLRRSEARRVELEAN